MSKIAYVGLPAHGHSNPTLPLLKRLVENGRHITIYNAESFRAKFAPTSAVFHPFPEPMPTEREIAERMGRMVDASLLLSELSRPLTHFLIEAFEKERPDLVLYDSAAMWGYVAARVHNIPNICLITTFVLDGSQRALGFGTLLRFIGSALPHAPKLLRWRRQMAQEFGSENAGGLTEYADTNIVFTSREFHPPNSIVDGRFHFVGPSIDASTRNNNVPFELLDDKTSVYVSLGTINHLDYSFYAALFDAFAQFPAQFILSAGKSTDLTQLDTIPANFSVYPYVPQLEVLQQVDGFITHGGMNSVHEGLYFGVPEVVVPHHFEQLLNGKRVAEVGAGVLIGDKRPYGKVTPTQLRSALQAILDDPTYRQNANQIGETLKNGGGFETAVAIIEQAL